MSQNAEMLERLMEIMKGLNLPGDVIFSKIAGSHSHNCNIPESDLDAIGVYIVETNRMLGLDMAENKIEETVVNETNDFTAHEVGKFCRLLLKGNPGIIEMLWTDKMCYVTAPWKDLRAERKRFLSRRVIGQYLGYMNAQMIRLEKDQRLHTSGGVYGTKWAYHFLRLCGEATKISRGEEPDVWLEGHERDVLMKVRAGKYSQAQVLEMAKRMIGEVEKHKPWKLPEEGDREWLNDWLLKARRQKGGA